MKNTFAQCRELLSDKRRLAALKRALIRKYRERNIFDRWKVHSASAAIGCEFDI